MMSISKYERISRIDFTNVSPVYTFQQVNKIMFG